MKSFVRLSAKIFRFPALLFSGKLGLIGLFPLTNHSSGLKGSLLLQTLSYDNAINTKVLSATTVLQQQDDSLSGGKNSFSKSQEQTIDKPVEASPPSQTNSSSGGDGIIYRMYGDQWGCYDCKAKGDKHWLEQHPCKGQPIKSGNGKSKNKSSSAVADTAKANQSGNGVLFGQDKQDILDDDQ